MTIITKTTDESQTSHRRVTNDYRQITEDYRQVIDESQTTTDESQRTTTNHSKSFFGFINKTLFSERIWFPNASLKRWFLLKEGKSRFDVYIKVMETPLHKKSDNFKFLRSFSLDIRA